MSRSFDRGGLLGFVSFILPLILDGIFHKALPSVFAPNTLAMMQREDLRFVDVRWRKRRDRALQVAIFTAFAATFVMAVTTAVRAVVGAVLARNLTPISPISGLLAAPVAIFGARWLSQRRQVQGDVADVLAAQQKQMHEMEAKADNAAKEPELQQTGPATA
eukprot:6193806-Pleurochrysis_carterae.AAC.2